MEGFRANARNGMNFMNVTGTVEALEALNQRLQKPISRQLFSQSIQPELLRTGYAKLIAGTTVIDGEAWRGWRMVEQSTIQRQRSGKVS